MAGALWADLARPPSMRQRATFWMMDGRQIDRPAVGPLMLCALCVVMDGFDVQAMGYVAPAIMYDWCVSKASVGRVFGAGLFGMLVCSLTLSVFAVRVGLRQVLIGATLFFSLCMLATAWATSVSELLALRFITGLGLGAIMPNAMALAGEHSPARTRVTMMMRVSVGFTVGAVLGGLISSALIPRWGWQSVFYIGGVVPLVIAALMFRYLPESHALDGDTRRASARQLSICSGRAERTRRRCCGS